jgi:hypothetical protein
MIVSVPSAELVCVECRRRADAQARRWQAHLLESDDNEDEDELVFFCPACAAREFGELRPRWLDPLAR